MAIDKLQAGLTNQEAYFSPRQIWQKLEWQ
jgi:hypothetical protein